MSQATKILIVDDDPIVRSLMRATLEVEGFTIIEAIDGEEACRLYSEHHPDALISDVAMPRMDGYELCRELRRRPVSAHVPILMATGFDDVASIAKAYEVGATDFIAKPLNWVILKHRVRYMLRAARVFARTGLAIGEAGVPLRSFSNMLKILIVDDDPVIRTLMRATLENDGFDVVEAFDGEEALLTFSDQRPDAVVADVLMPRLDGFELCRELRRRPESAHVPILMATGLDDVGSISKAYEAGATDFISKPINWVILNHRVRYMLRAARAFEDLRKNQQDLIAAKNAAEAASRAKSDFLANMSHELRTPLNAIIGFSSMMREEIFGSLPDKYAEYAKDINESGTHLLAIINDILDLTRAESNKMMLREEEIPIEPDVEFSMNVVKHLADSAEVNTRVTMAANLPLLVADSGKLRQILINLLSNSVKFTPAGGTVSLDVVLERNGGVTFRVEDTGIGIPADKIEVAMAPFGQVDSGLARKYNGVGLGLPLSKRLTELHGGTFGIESVSGKGTIITLRFPSERVRPRAMARAAAQ